LVPGYNCSSPCSQNTSSWRTEQKTAMMILISLGNRNYLLKVDVRFFFVFTCNVMPPSQGNNLLSACHELWESVDINNCFSSCCRSSPLFCLLDGPNLQISLHECTWTNAACDRLWPCKLYMLHLALQSSQLTIWIIDYSYMIDAIVHICIFDSLFYFLRLLM
jgi:hypothetical protein